MPLQPKLPDIPDPPPNHRLRTLTFLATAFVLVASVGSDSYRNGPVGRQKHIFTHVRRAWRAALAGGAARGLCVAECE